MQISNETVGSIHYTLKDSKGTIIDSSQGEEPLAYLHGAGNLVPGLEAALEGRSAGQSLNVIIAPEDGYGIRDDELQRAFPLEKFENADQVEPGVQFHLQLEGEDEPRVATVMQIEDGEVFIDMNHPLAGVELHFDIEVTDVRAASAEEIAHGHIHGGAGCCGGEGDCCSEDDCDCDDDCCEDDQNTNCCG